LLREFEKKMTNFDYGKSDLRISKSINAIFPADNFMSFLLLGQQKSLYNKLQMPKALTKKLAIISTR